MTNKTKPTEIMNSADQTGLIEPTNAADQSGPIETAHTTHQTKPTGTYEMGLKAEDMAAWYLEQKGYRILEKRFRIRQGEIDLIASGPAEASSQTACGPAETSSMAAAPEPDGQGVLVFAEVKYRRDLSHGRPSQLVDQKKQNRILQAARVWLARNQRSDQSVRFDVLEIWQEKGHHKIHHYENAFGENL